MYYHWFASVPNLITIGRLILTPIAIDLIVTESWKWAFGVFVVAGVSDAIDGWLARTFNLRSELGAVLDPLADKALIVSMFVTLSAVGQLPAWVAIMVVVARPHDRWRRRYFLAPPPPRRDEAPDDLEGDDRSPAGPGGPRFRPSGVRSGDWTVDRRFSILMVTALTVASASVYLWRWVKHMGP